MTATPPPRPDASTTSGPAYSSSSSTWDSGLDSAIPASSLPIIEGFQASSEGSMKPNTTPTPVILIYPTIHPDTVIVPMVCSIVLFPILVAAAICLLKYYNERARAKDRFRAGFQAGARTMFTMGKIGAVSKASASRKPCRVPWDDLLSASTPRPRIPQDSLFQCMPELELDTVFEMDKEQSESSPSPTSRNSSGTHGPIQVAQLHAPPPSLPSPTAVIAVNSHDHIEVILDPGGHTCQSMAEVLLDTAVADDRQPRATPEDNDDDDDDDDGEPAFKETTL